MATDPVCKMQVDPQKSVSSSYKGQTYYFCCDACKTSFEKEPQKYVGA
ncbi:MAG: YHS domain-containing protein [Firmicutes bacterium]|nr:YHS domain-containing protein [Bacillota bacterium]